MKRLDFNMIMQLRAEIEEAENQIRQAKEIIQYQAEGGMDARTAWLAWHKCHEAATNLLNVAEALR